MIVDSIRAVTLGAGTLAASASTVAGGTHVYAVVFQVQDAASASLTRETLSVENNEGHTYVQLANPNGPEAGFAATLAPDGEIENDPHDAALICYNMAISLVAQHARAPRGPLSLVVLVGGRPVAVRLGLRAESAPTAIVAAGRYGDAVVDARIDLDSGFVSDAAFEEIAVAGSPAKVRSRTMCAFTDQSRGTPGVKHVLERS